jgi:hypothetical protein
MPLPCHRSDIDDQQIAIASNILDRGAVKPQQTTE